MGLLLAAHGSRSEDGVPDCLSVHVERIKDRRLFDEVWATYYKEPPFYPEAFQRLSPLDHWHVNIVPMLASKGHYCDTVLPKALGLTGSETHRGPWTLRLTEPIGACPAIAEMLTQSARCALRSAEFPADRTAVILVGHGTPRHPRSDETTHRHVRTLRELLCRQNPGREPGVSEVKAAFLDQEPYLDDIYTVTSCPNVVVVPNLIGGSHHVAVDIPSRLGLRARGLDVVHSVGRRSVVVTSPIFEDEAVSDLILQLAQHTGAPIHARPIEGSHV